MGYQPHSPTNRADIHELKARVDLRVIAEQTLGQARRRSSNYMQFLAPNRDDRNASLTVWADGFKDFGNPDCRGDVFTFLELFQGLDFKAALDVLRSEAGLREWREPLPPQSATHKNATRQPQPDWRAVAAGALQQCQTTLHSMCGQPIVQHYLHPQGYTDATLKARGIGFNPQWRKLAWLKPDGKPAWLPPGIVYPWYQDGQLVGLKVRLPYTTNGDNPDDLAQLMNHKPGPAKYMQVAGGAISTAWYGDLDDPTLPVILVEGEKDCDNLWQRLKGLANVITLGSATGRLPDALIERLQHAPWIILALDNDTAGRSNTNRLDRELQQRTGRVVFPAHFSTDHNDLTDWILDDGDVVGWFTRQADIVTRIALRHGPQRQTATIFPQGVPNILRSTLLRLHQECRYVKDHANAAVVMEIRQEAVQKGLLDENALLTVPTLVKLATQLQRNTTTSTLRRGIEQLIALGFLELIPHFHPSSEPKENTEEIKGGKSENKLTRRRGRPTLHYKAVPLVTALVQFVQHVRMRLYEGLYAEIPDDVLPEWFTDIVDADTAHEIARLIWDEVDWQLDVGLETVEAYLAYLKRGDELEALLSFDALIGADSAPLPSEMSLTNGRAYRDAVYAAYIGAEGVFGRQITRAESAAGIGVSSRTLTEVRRRTGVVAEPQYKSFELARNVDVNEQANEIARWAEDRPFGRFLVSERDVWMRLRVDDPDDMDKFVMQEMAQGHRVWLRVQVASLERFGTPEELAQNEAEAALALEPTAYPRQEPSKPAEPRPQDLHPTTGEVLATVEPETVSPDGPTRGFVVDQMRMRLPLLYPLMEQVPGLKEVLAALGVDAVARGSAEGRAIA